MSSLARKNWPYRMKTLVVNLDKDEDRWAIVEAQLMQSRLDFERAPGILGLGLSESERATHYDPVKASWRLARQLTPSEIGCALSHIRIYREISKRNLPRALVLEDDVLLPSDLAHLLGALARHLPADQPIVCLLSPAEAALGAAGVRLCGDYTLFPYGQGFYASSYALTRAAAEILLGDLHPVADVADCWVRLARTGRLRFFVVTPAAISQNQQEFGSSTSADIRAALGGSALAKMPYRLRRVRNIALAGLIEKVWRAKVRPVGPDVAHPIDALKG